MEAKALTTQDLTRHDLVSDELTGRDPLTDNLSGDLATELADDLTSELAGDLTSELAGAADTVTTDAVAAESHIPFEQFGVAESICADLTAAGITHAFPIQALTLPIALDKHDVIGQARTGTGKTLAFAIPIVQHALDTSRGKPTAPRSLVVVPTRELAIQVADDLRTTATSSNVNIVTLYGGRAYEPQIEALATVDVVVGTPGRLLDLCRQRQLDLSGVDILVLDEADRMLDLGFLPDVEAILRMTPSHRQTMLFSATMPAEIVTLARRHLYRPTHIRAEQHDEPAHVPTTHQHVFRAHQLDKIEVLVRVLQAEGRGLTIVFCRTRRSCDNVTSELTRRGFAAAAVHGDLGQSQRERALRAFRSGKIDVLVATDVAARGLDVDDVTHVVNHECPEDEKAYLHRIGRTGRAGKAGVAVTFIDWQDMSRWKLINETLNLGHPEPLETYSTSEHLYTALGIPAGATGSLPRSQRERAGLAAEDLEDIGETGKNRSKRAADESGGHGQRSRSGRSASGGKTPRDPAAKTRPTRRRTRAGAPVAATTVADGSHLPDAQAPVAEVSAGPEHQGTPDQPAAAKPRGRRRRRGGRPAEGHAAEVRRRSVRPAGQAEQRDIELN